MASRSINMQCWKCGEELKNLLLPFSRYEECSVCKADLHACLSCKHYDPARSDACREDRADFVLDKDKANFCDYFAVNPRAYNKKANAEAMAARARLAELFGEEDAELAVAAMDSSPQTEAEQALAKLKALFGDDS